MPSVGVASHATTIAEREAERDAQPRQPASDAHLSFSLVCRQAAIDGGAHLVDARAPPGTTPRRCTAADGGTRRRRWRESVTSAGRPRAVAGRIGRTVDPDDRRAQRGGQVQRPGVAGDDEPARRADRQELAERRRRRDAPPRRRPPRRPRAPASSSPGPQATIDGQPWRARRWRRDGAEAFGRPALVRPRRARVDQRERLPRREPERRRGRGRRRPTRAAAARTAAARAGRRSPARAPARCRRRAAPAGVDASVVGPARERLAQVLAGETDDARRRQPGSASVADFSSPCASIATS